jgi:hypothetical protein
VYWQLGSLLIYLFIHSQSFQESFIGNAEVSFHSLMKQGLDQEATLSNYPSTVLAAPRHKRPRLAFSTIYGSELQHCLPFELPSHPRGPAANNPAWKKRGPPSTDLELFFLSFLPSCRLGAVRQLVFPTLPPDTSTQRPQATDKTIERDDLLYTLQIRR